MKYVDYLNAELKARDREITRLRAERAEFRAACELWQKRALQAESERTECREDKQRLRTELARLWNVCKDIVSTPHRSELAIRLMIHEALYPKQEDRDEV